MAFEVEDVIDTGGDVHDVNLLVVIDLVLLDLYLLSHQDLPLDLALLLKHLVVQPPSFLELPLVDEVVLFEQGYLFSQDLLLPLSIRELSLDVVQFLH